MNSLELRTDLVLAALSTGSGQFAYLLTYYVLALSPTISFAVLLIIQSACFWYIRSLFIEIAAQKYSPAAPRIAVDSR